MRKDEENEKRREDMVASDMVIAKQYQEVEMKAAGIHDLVAHLGMAGHDDGVGGGAVPETNVDVDNFRTQTHSASNNVKVTSVSPLLPNAVKKSGVVLASEGADEKQRKEEQWQGGSGRAVHNPSHGQNNKESQSGQQRSMQESGRPKKMNLWRRLSKRVLWRPRRKGR